MWNEIAAQAGSNCTCARTCLPKPSRSILRMLVALPPGCSRNILVSKRLRSHPPMPKRIETICLPNGMLPRPSIGR